MRSFSSFSIKIFFFVFFFKILFQGEERLLFPWNPFALFHRAFQSLQLIIIRIVRIRRGIIIGAFYYLVTSRSRGIYQSHEHVFRSSRSCSSSSSSRDNHRHFCAAKKCGKETRFRSNEEDKVIIRRRRRVKKREKQYRVFVFFS